MRSKRAIILAGCAMFWLALSGLSKEAVGDLPGVPRPKGYGLVAEDDCGSSQQSHVVRGTAWTYPPGMVEAVEPYRTLVFDNQECVLR